MPYSVKEYGISFVWCTYTDSRKMKTLSKGVPAMQLNHIEARTLEFAEYIISHDATVRQTADVFHISKSTVHKDIRQRLRNINLDLYEQVVKVLEHNLKERHIRGGIATKEKYEKLRNKKKQ